MNEKESKTNEQETKQPTSSARQVKRYSGEKNKKVTAKLNETETGPVDLAEKNKDDNSNLPLTEDKTTARTLNSTLRFELPSRLR